MNDFCYKCRVYYEHTDAGGVVYHGRYVNFFDQARTEWLRYHGLEQNQMRREAGVLLVVHGIQIDYLQPAFLDDELLIDCRVKSHSGVRMVLVQSIRIADKLIAKAEVTVVSVNDQRFKPMRFPNHYLNKLINHV